MATNANPLYPTETPFTTAADINRRLCQIEERLLIVDQDADFPNQYPELVKSYKKFKEEEAKMLTFEALKNS